MGNHYRLEIKDSIQVTDDVVQVKSPRNNRYIKIDRTVGRIVEHKKSEEPYKDVPIARKKRT